MAFALQIDNLKKVYGSQTESLKGISFNVAEGDFFALLGPNGAGKSTTLGIVSSLVNKSSGGVKIFGYDLDSQNAIAKSLLGVVPQEFNFNQFEKVYDIVVTQAGYYGIPAKEAGKRAEYYLKKLGLWDKRSTPSRMLSGGMKRRLMIARALVHDPRLLILDEPTAGVDIELRRSMWEFLKEINAQGTTIILTTHYLEEAEALCRNIAIIDKGSILENTTKKALLAKLNMETFVLESAEPLLEPPALDGYVTRLGGDGNLEVDVARGAMLNGAFGQLDAAGIKVTSMRTKANRLEELFVKLVENKSSR